MSRLTTNSEEYRERIEARNLYSPLNPYRLEEGDLISAIDSIASVLSPFNTPDIGNSIIGRLANPINTPIQQIGLEMLAKQFGYTVASLSKAEFQPSVNFANLFDGDPNTKLITKKVDFQITRRESQGFLGRFLEEVTGVNRPINPFNNNPTNLDYFNQTGKGQQLLLIGNLNQSIYKPSSISWQEAVDGAGLKYGNPIELTPQTYFSGLNSELYPYDTYSYGLNVTDSFSLNRTLTQEKQNFINSLDGEKSYEYGSTQKYLDGFGRTEVKSNSDNAGNYVIDDKDNGLSDDTSRKIIWGRDGIDTNYSGIVKGFDKNPNEVPTKKADDGDLTSATYNEQNDRFISGDAPKTGLLNFTKELLNSRGKYGNFDLTKKKFVDRDGNLHFQGLPLSRNAQGEIDRSRQHNITDPYNRFAKAIRFQGNEIYGGNENSVINKSVTPKIAPNIKKDGTTDVKNLMFSIENLAFNVAESGDVQDNSGIRVPDCEIGSRGGRLMWFAPYDIRFSEQSVAKHNDTVFIGRSEPIYTYNNSERLANLSFKLLIDYPPQIKGDPTIENSQSQKARFFAFGSEGTLQRPVDIGQKEREIEILQEQLNNNTPNKEVDTTANIPTQPILKVYFPNDVPIIGAVEGSVANIIGVDPNDEGTGYEDGIVGNDAYPNDDGLNVAFKNKIDQVIESAFSEENRGKYRITVRGFATQLFLGGDEASELYNRELTERRVNSTIAYLNFKYQQKYNRTLEQDGIRVFPDPRGDEGASDATATPESIPELESKVSRRTEIIFQPILQRLEPRGIDDTISQNTTRDTNNLFIQTRIEQLRNEINQEKKRIKQGFECTFNQYKLEDGIFKGWESSQRRVNAFVPVFHSQTPEDFHRRLTFLQQCVRQGEAIRSDRDDGDNNTQVGANNSVFGRQPVQILRLGDFFHSKVIIDNISFEYDDAPWDMNPEGMGMQFMMANIDIQMKVIGGQSMSTAVDVLQNAISFNYYANSTFYDNGVYQNAVRAENAQIKKNEKTSDSGNNNDNENN